MKLLKISLFAFVFLALFTLANNTRALDAGALGIKPANPDPTQPFGKSWFIYTAEIGKEIKDQVEVTNLADVPVKARVWAADAVTTPDGAFAVKEESEESIDIGAWITLSEGVLDLTANETKTIDFVLKVPENAEVGDHMGAIMTQAIGTLAELGQGKAEIAPGIKVVTRMGARVYLTVPGEIVTLLEFPKFSWEMKDNKFYFLLTFGNKGNVRIEPQGTIIVKNLLGAKIGELTIPTRVVFPRGEIIIPVEWEKLPLWVQYGGFAAEAEVTYGPGLALTQELKAVALPWYIPVIFGGIIIFLLLLWIAKKRRKKQ